MAIIIIDLINDLEIEEDVKPPKENLPNAELIEQYRKSVETQLQIVETENDRG